MLYLIAKAASEAAGAGENPIVTCSGLDCNVCSLVKMVVNTFYYLTWWLSFPAAILFIVIGGFIYIGSRGNEVWMSLAKRAILYAVGGFGIILLAYLAINTTLQVIGSNDASIWSKFDCPADSSAQSNTPPEKRLEELANSVKKGGQLSGRIPNGTGADEIFRSAGSLDSNNMMVIESDVQQTNNVLATISKDNNNQPDLLYVNGSLINNLLQPEKKTSLLFSEAEASETDGSPATEKLAELSQIIALVIEKNQSLVAVVTDKPGVGVYDNRRISISDISKAVGNINQCIKSSGVWYRFSEICQAEQENCSATKCTISGNFNPVSQCKCPEDKCLNKGQCVKR